MRSTTGTNKDNVRGTPIDLAHPVYSDDLERASTKKHKVSDLEAAKNA